MVVSAWFEGEVTLLPFPYLRVGVLLACGFSGVRGSSRPWVRGLVLWPLDGPGTYLTLGSSLLLPVLAAGLRWLRFILGCPPSVASLWRGLTWFFIRYWLACPHGAAVPLDSWDRSPISGPSVFFLSPRPLHCFPSFGWVCFWS